MNFIKEFFKNHENHAFQTECEIRAVDLWQEVDIDFLDDEKRRNETSFDVKNVLSKSGQSELSILFDDFCSENNLRHPEIISVTVVKSVQTHQELAYEADEDHEFKNEIVDSKLLSGYTWRSFEDGSGSLYSENGQKVLEYDMIHKQYRMYVGSKQDWQEIPNGYLLRKFKTFAEEKIIKM